MHAGLAELARRLAADGIATEHAQAAGEAIVAHVPGDAGAWLGELERYVRRVLTRPGLELWPVLHFVVPPLLPVTGRDFAAFARLLRAVGELLVVREDHRLEQYGLRCAAEALVERPAELQVVLAGAHTLLAAGCDAGWLLQIAVPPLAAAERSPAGFAAQWQGLVAFAQGVHAGGIHVGYPLSTGLGALLAREDAAGMPRWLELLQPLALAARRDAYGLFEYALPGLASGTLDADGVVEALRLALAMFDHGMAPGPTLQALNEPLQLAIATRLAQAGVDPALVITNGVQAFAMLGLLEDGGERLCTLAIELHRRGLRQLLFEDGLHVLHELDRLGLAGTALDLVEAMVARDLEPGVLMRWSLPRTLPMLRPEWAPGEVLVFARALVDLGTAPESAVQWAARPMVEAAHDAAAFRRSSQAVVQWLHQLQARGVAAEDVLFHDVAHLADTGQGSQAFVDLLALFSQLLGAFAVADVDPQRLLTIAVPAAARAASGRPWVLVAALTAATRLGAEHRHAEALALLESGVATAAEYGGADGEHFARAMALVEERYATLPPVLTGPAAAAATHLAGADLQRLADALAMLGAASARHGEALLSIASALPDLARLGTPLAAFGGLLDTAVAVAADEPEFAQLAEIAARCCQDAAEGRTVLVTIARLLREQPDRRATLTWFARVARLARPANLAELFGVVHTAFAACREPKLLIELLERARDADELRRMGEVVPPLLATGQPTLLDGLAMARDLVARYPFGWSHLVLPTLVTAKERAGSLLYALRALPSRCLATVADGALIQQLITQFGVRAVDIVQNLLWPAAARGVMVELAAHAELLPRYLREVGFADADVYAQFVRIAAEASADERAARVADLRHAIEGLTAAIRAGDVAPAQRQHALFGVALQNVFPPAMSALRQDYEQLTAKLPDRPHDVSALWPGAATTAIEVLVGGWQLVPEPGELDAFGWGERVLPTAETATVPLPELGWQILTAWSEDRLARAATRHAFVQSLLAHLPAALLPEPTFGSAGQLLAIRQLASDRLLACVEQALLAARGDDRARYDRLVHDKLQPTPRVGPGLVKSVAATVRAVAAGTLDKDTAERRLTAQLQAFAVPQDLLAALQAEPSLLQRLSPRPIELAPGKEIGRVHADLVGQELAAMNATIARAIAYRPSSEVLRLDAVLTKRSVHAPIGLCTGVCTAGDLQLWNTPGFVHLALFGDGVCRGGVHLLVVEEAKRRYLAVPGINPTAALLEQVDPAALLRVLLEHVRSLAKQAGLAGVWVPTSPGIHSNRAAIGAALLELNLPRRATAGHAFSFSPYAYRIDEVWEL